MYNIGCSLLLVNLFVLHTMYTDLLGNVAEPQTIVSTIGSDIKEFLPCDFAWPISGHDFSPKE